MPYIPITSLIIAALAVFVGPIITWLIAKRQLAVNAAVSNKQIIAPLRQVWINNLRDLLSEIASLSLHYYVSWFEDRTDDEYKYLTHLEYKIILMLNPAEDDHQKLEKIISQLISMLSAGEPDRDREFEYCHKAVVALSRDVLKREWNSVKEPISTILTD